MRAPPGSCGSVSGDGEAAGVRAGSKARLADELATAANVPLWWTAVDRSYRLESTRRTGWPVTRWLLQFRPDPLRRLNLRSSSPSELNRTSLPPAGAPERARTDAAVREFADAASAGAPGPWRAAIRGAAREGRERLPDALDQAIAGTDLMAARKSWWWGVFNVVQWLALLTVLGGLGWLGVLAGLGYLQLPVPDVPRVEGWPVPTLMIAGGAVLGDLPGADREIHRGRGRPCAGRHGQETAQGRRWCRGRGLVVEPVEVEVSRLRSFNAALEGRRRAGPAAGARSAAASRRLRKGCAASRTLIRVRRFRVVVVALYFALDEILLKGLSSVPPAGASQASASGPSRFCSDPSSAAPAASSSSSMAVSDASVM